MKSDITKTLSGVRREPERSEDKQRDKNMKSKKATIGTLCEDGYIGDEDRLIIYKGTEEKSRRVAAGKWFEDVILRMIDREIADMSIRTEKGIKILRFRVEEEKEE